MHTLTHLEGQKHMHRFGVRSEFEAETERRARERRSEKRRESIEERKGKICPFEEVSSSLMAASITEISAVLEVLVLF